MNECVFCKIVSKEILSEFVDETSNLFVINDANPVYDGHCLIITKKHYETVFDVPVILGNEILEMAKRQGLRLIKEGRADGIKLVQNNFEAAGQAVKHFHLHVIPEKNNCKREKTV
jgi:histidine triad (HIT) family protein